MVTSSVAGTGASLGSLARASSSTRTARPRGEACPTRLDDRSNGRPSNRPDGQHHVPEGGTRTYPTRRVRGAGSLLSVTISGGVAGGQAGHPASREADASDGRRDATHGGGSRRQRLRPEQSETGRGWQVQAVSGSRSISSSSQKRLSSSVSPGSTIRNSPSCGPRKSFSRRRSEPRSLWTGRP